MAKGNKAGIVDQEDLFRQRSMAALRAKLDTLGKQRRARLQASLKRYIRHQMAFALEEGRTAEGLPQVHLITAGEARGEGAELKSVPRFKLAIQETLRIDGKPPEYVAHYTYAFHDAETGALLFRFEYHPHLPNQKAGKQNPWSLVHHLHVEDGTMGVRRIHFPIMPFLRDPDERPHEVLARIMEWCETDLAS